MMRKNQVKMLHLKKLLLHRRQRGQQHLLFQMKILGLQWMLIKQLALLKTTLNPQLSRHFPQRNGKKKYKDLKAYRQRSEKSNSKLIYLKLLQFL